MWLSKYIQNLLGYIPEKKTGVNIFLIYIILLILIYQATKLIDVSWSSLCFCDESHWNILNFFFAKHKPHMSITKIVMPFDMNNAVTLTEFSGNSFL